MAFHELFRWSEEFPVCGRSVKRLGRTNWYGAEALAAAVPARGNIGPQIRSSPTGQTEDALRDGLRLPRAARWSWSEMRVNEICAEPVAEGMAAWKNSFVEANCEMAQNASARLARIRRSNLAAWAANSFFYASLWLSLLAAIWLSRGWIGLFFSGQVLCAGSCLVQRLVKRTQYAFCANTATSTEFEDKTCVL